MVNHHLCLKLVQYPNQLGIAFACRIWIGLDQNQDSNRIGRHPATNTCRPMLEWSMRTWCASCAFVETWCCSSHDHSVACAVVFCCLLLSACNSHQRLRHCFGWQHAIRAAHALALPIVDMFHTANKDTKEPPRFEGQMAQDECFRTHWPFHVIAKQVNELTKSAPFHLTSRTCNAPSRAPTKLPTTAPTKSPTTALT